MFATLKGIESIIVDLDIQSTRLSEVYQFISQNESNFRWAGVALSSVNAPSFQHPIFTPANFDDRMHFEKVIFNAIQSLGGELASAVLITSNPEKVKAANQLLIGTVAVGIEDNAESSLYQHFPDFVVHDFSQISDILTGKYLGYAGEYFSFPGPNRTLYAHPFLQTQKTSFAAFAKIPNSERPGNPFWVSGRYFDSRDPRHRIHPLTLRIIGAKERPERQDSHFAWLITYFLTHYEKNADILACVPSRPSRGGNRLEKFLKKVKPPNSSTVIEPNLITCQKEYKPMKDLSKVQREMEIQDAFDVSQKLDGKKVILFDDIISTSATINSCIDLLMKNGASKVIPVALAYHPFRPTISSLSLEDDLKCSTCQSPMYIRFNTQNANIFFGCQHGRSGQSGHPAIDFRTGSSVKLDAFHKLASQEASTTLNWDDLI